ncbi:hypothetical protein B0T20DRAFT_171276 [Sordaria brevicollis]|uniref:CFEM domain-containing protein n=1 Tax=Sordaria brevicollis TaxID=83679 RepID=A0AAE0UD69_SORBR|nr:hypothetical protein B0T20DRAFT_171276 [Sordaria brevicollis]
MKFTAALFALASASFAAAQDLGNLPSCATECAGGYLINGIGDCGRDPKCICTNETFIKDIQCCLLEKCPTSDIEAAAGFAITFCKNNGATDFPTKATCATAAATQTTAIVTTATDAATTVSASNSSALSSAVSSITSAASSAASSAPTSNPGPRQTAAAGLGAIGGLMAAVAML